MGTLANIYSDIDLTFTRQPVTGDIALSYDDQAVIRSVRNLLLTNHYERPFQPVIGSNLDSFLFENIVSSQQAVIEKEIADTIRNFEPRVTINSIVVTADEINNAYDVTLSFFIGNNTQPTVVGLLLERSR
jgi:phage baseplate assembly protein W